MSGGFFRGTSADQDTRFSNKQAKLLKSQKFLPELDHPVDMTKVKMDVIRPWIATRATELLGFEDEVLINFVYGLLDGKEVDGKHIQIQLTGFMEKNTSKFMKELWSLLLSAQNNVSGVPQQFLDAKEEEQRKKKEENDRIAQEIQKRKERSRELEREKESRMDSEDGKGGPVKSGPDFSQSRASSGQPAEESEEDRTNDQNIRNRDGQRSRSRSASSQSQRISSSPRNQYQSPVTRSLTPEKQHRSPRLHPISPPEKYSPARSRSPERSPHIRKKLISWSRHRSPPPYWRRTSRRRSPDLHRRSPSPLRRRSRSPIHHRSPSFRRRSPSPLRHRSPIHRRSPQVRYRSPSPLRYESPFPISRRSPQLRSMKQQKQSSQPRSMKQQNQSPCHSPYESPSPIRRSPQPKYVKQQKQSPRHSPLSRPADRHALQSAEGVEYGPGGARGQRSSLVNVHDEGNSARKVATENYQEKEHAMTNNNQPSINDVLPRLKVTNYEEDNREREHDKRHRKKFDNPGKDMEESSDTDSEVEDRKEAKRKKEKRLRKEEKRRRREERHRRRLERRAAKQKAKANDAAIPRSIFERHQRVGNELEGDAGDTMLEQKRLEIELREKALESLRAKKAISD
ncbi:hypothetical protein AXF42_Ash008761 [Apostasia shenzhenica]|uniref:PWI domain-containing protein n=1 Tax=Apostasia shenzhenica TaxID=1088818 RepID=A0A2I0B2B0_9ASPA|nr:hypothetical protein AXF42_Ash008761 [Apostasia shenzhenica]